MSRKLLDIIEEASPRDKLLGYLKSSRQGDIHLTDKEMEYMERIDYCDDVIRAHPGAREIELRNMVATKYGISNTHAQKMLADTRYIHGTTAKPVRQYERMRLNEFLMGIIAKNEISQPEVAIKAMDLYMRLNKLDDTELDAEGDEESGPKNIIIRPVFAPEQLGVELPENINDIIKQLRERTRVHKKAIEAING